MGVCRKIAIGGWLSLMLCGVAAAQDVQWSPFRDGDQSHRAEPTLVADSGVPCDLPPQSHILAIRDEPVADFGCDGQAMAPQQPASGECFPTFADGCAQPCVEKDYALDWQWGADNWWTRDLSVFGGVHGFKGPFDQGSSGNFGVQEGLNFGAPLGFWDWGFQVGMTAAQSNFCGDEVLNVRSADRNQYFFTGGIFHRAVDWGLQWGVVYDWLHDQYYADVDMKQIRSDSSFLLPGGVHEIGYFGAYGTGGQNFVLLDRQLKYYIFMEPTDVFAFYYRHYFSGGGVGRIWGGFSGRGDGIVGAELRVPLGTSWALENRFNYLIPKQGSGQGGSTQESYGVTIQLVWYPGQSARCVESHPYRPMLNVADNTLFMTDTFVPPGVPQ
jgi:hypothetical protein